MGLNQIPDAEWTKFLPAQLNSKCSKVLATLSLEENQNYNRCKKAILDYNQFTPQSYLKAFSTLQRERAKILECLRTDKRNISTTSFSLKK